LSSIPAYSEKIHSVRHRRPVGAPWKRVVSKRRDLTIGE
jgi:hypothetical protein